MSLPPCSVISRSVLFHSIFVLLSMCLFFSVSFIVSDRETSDRLSGGVKFYRSFECDDSPRTKGAFFCAAVFNSRVTVEAVFTAGRGSGTVCKSALTRRW